MPYNPLSQYHRRSVRLQGYDYSQAGAYFITICTHNRECLFGAIKDGEKVLNERGKVVQQYWSQIPEHFPKVELDAFVVMPNHMHGIIIIGVNVGANNHSPLLPNTQQPIQPNKLRSPSKTIGSVVRGFKIGVTKWFRNNTNIYQVWQRNYYERIIRSEAELNKVREYIMNNPLNWALDENYIG